MTEFYEEEQKSNTTMFIVIGIVIVVAIVLFVVRSSNTTTTTTPTLKREERYKANCVIGEGASHCPHAYEDTEQTFYMNLKQRNSDGTISDRYVKVDTSKKDNLCSSCTATTEQITNPTVGIPRGGQTGPARNGWSKQTFIKDANDDYHAVDNTQLCDNSFYYDSDYNMQPVDAENGLQMCAASLHANRKELNTTMVLIIIVVILLAAGILVAIMLDKDKKNRFI